MRSKEGSGKVDEDREMRHGVAAGNEILQEKERLVRMGGQELVGLVHCPIGSAWERLDRLRRSMSDRPFLPESGRDPQVITFSGGLAAIPANGGHVSALLGHADSLLQLTNSDLGNRVVERNA